MDEFQPSFWSGFMKNRQQLTLYEREIVHSKPVDIRRPPFYVNCLSEFYFRGCFRLEVATFPDPRNMRHFLGLERPLLSAIVVAPLP
jgi:hypothetical protein